MEKVDMLWSFCCLGDSLSWTQVKIQFMHQVHHAPCKRKFGPQTQMACIACNTMTGLCPVGFVTSMDQVSLQDLLDKMQLDDLEKVLSTGWLRWHGYVKHSDGWLQKIKKLNLGGSCGHRKTGRKWFAWPVYSARSEAYTSIVVFHVSVGNHNRCIDSKPYLMFQMPIKKGLLTAGYIIFI